MRSNIFAGIDIGTSTTRVVVVEFDKKGKTPRILATGKSDTKGVRQGYITNADDVIQSIRRAVESAEKNCGFKIKRAFVSIGGVTLDAEIGHGSAIIARGDKEVTNLDITKAINESEDNLQIVNKRIIHEVPISFKLDGKDVLGTPESMQGIKLEVKNLFITGLEQHLEDIIAAVNQAGIEVTDIIASPIAASAVTLTERQKTVGCALLDIGAETTNIIIFENGTILSLHTLPLGGTDITNDIALGFKIPLDEAEGVKIGSVMGDYPKKKLDEIIEARLSDIFELTEKHFKKIGRNGLLPAGVIITGGASSLYQTEGLAKKILKLPSKIGEAEIFSNTKHKKALGAGWLVPFGLCVAGRQMDTPHSRRQSQDSLGLIRFFKGFFSQLLP